MSRRPSHRPASAFAATALACVLLGACGGASSTEGAAATSRADLVAHHRTTTPAERLLALAADVHTLGERLAAASDAQVAELADAPGQLRSALEPLRLSAVALSALAATLDSSAGRRPADEARALRASAAAARTQLAALEALSDALAADARSVERLRDTAALAARAGRDAVAVAARVEAAVRLVSGDPRETDTLARLEVSTARLVSELDARVRRLASVTRQVHAAAHRAAHLSEDVARTFHELMHRAERVAATVSRRAGQSRALGAVLATVAGVVGAYERAIGRVTPRLVELGATVVTVAGGIAGSTGALEVALGDVDTTVDPLFPPAPASGSSLRVLTYNTAFLSATISLPWPLPDFVYDVNDGTFSGLDYAARADRIATGILQGDQDVVILNEVFSDDARAVLVERLKGRYPYYVSKLAGVPVEAIPTLGDRLQYYSPAVVSELIGLLLELVPFSPDYAVIPGDSGLMLFSAFPFLPLPAGAPNDAACGDDACVFEGSNLGGPVLPDEVAFRVFPHADIEDRYASKGVAVVKLDTPQRPTFVAFTHLQADALVHEEHAPTRETQYLDVQATLEAAASPAELQQDFVIFAGDLNSPGHNRAHPDDPSEWSSLFDPPTSGVPFFACGNDAPCSLAADGRLLTDSWGHETSVDDLGLSQLNDHERLDYIFHNSPDGRTCMQHIHIAWDVAEAESTWYSDHLPVRADFNRGAAQCGANDAAGSALHRPLDIVFPSASCDADPATPAPPCSTERTFLPPQAVLTHPGSFQWYRIEAAGSYSLELLAEHVGEDVKVDVYQGAELSRPIAPFSEEEHPRWGKPYALLHPPYFLRVHAVDAAGHDDRTASARGYRLTVHQHLCRTPEDACFLAPPVEYPYVWPEVTAFTNVSSVYFRFKTSGVDHGHLSPTPTHYPTVKFLREAPQGSLLDCLLPVTVEEYQGLNPPVFVASHPLVGTEVDGDADWDDDGHVDARDVAPALDGAAPDEFKQYYVKVSRKDALECEAPMTTWLREETNLTYFRPGRARCFNQYDDSGLGEDDHTRFHFFFDTPYVDDATYCDSHFCHAAVFDEPEGDSWLADVALLQGYFVDEVAIGMWEDDDGDDLVFDTSDDTVSAMHPYFERLESVLYVEDDPNPDDADYTYHLPYVLCREEAGCQF